MKKNSNIRDPKENLEITRQKKYQRKEKKPQVENQTLLKEKKKLPNAINKEWHEVHPMPPKATLSQRIAWHLEHTRNCKCREIPPRLREEMKKRNIEIPE